MRLPFRCWICDGPLPIVIVAIWSSGTIMLVPVTAIGRCSMLLGVDAIVRMQAHGDVARLAGRVDPVADLDAGERHAQRLRRVAHRDAQRVGQAAVELDLQLVLRLLLRQAHVDRARDLAQLVHEVAGDRHAAGASRGP